MVKLENSYCTFTAFIGSCLAGFLNYSLLGHEFTLNEILALALGKAMVGIQCQVFYLHSYIQLS